MRLETVLRIRDLPRKGAVGLQRDRAGTLLGSYCPRLPALLVGFLGLQQPRLLQRCAVIESTGPSPSGRSEFKSFTSLPPHPPGK